MSELLANYRNLRALTELNGRWIDRVSARSGLKEVTAGMESSDSRTHGKQECSVFDYVCYRPCIVPTSLATWSGRCCGRSIDYGSVREPVNVKTVLNDTMIPESARELRHAAGEKR